jgi:hypothetical protein
LNCTTERRIILSKCRFNRKEKIHRKESPRAAANTIGDTLFA